MTIFVWLQGKTGHTHLCSSNSISAVLGTILFLFGLQNHVTFLNLHDYKQRLAALCTFG